MAAGSYLGGDSRKHKGGSEENQTGKRDKPVEGYVSEEYQTGKREKPIKGYVSERSPLWASAVGIL